MAIHDFSYSKDPELISIDKLPDHRSDVEQEFTLLSLYQPENEDMAYAERVAFEMINITGAVTEIFVRTEDNDVDDVWDEQADPTYLPGVRIKGFFVPEPLKSELTKWGIDTPNKTKAVYSRAAIFKQFGNRMLRPGDIIEVPFGSIEKSRGKNKQQYRIVEPSEEGNFKYRWL